MTAEGVYQIFKDYLDNQGYKYTTDDGRLSISLTVRGEDLPMPTNIRVYADLNIVQIISPIPGCIPEDRRIDAALAVAIANYRMIGGCFDLNMNSGEICYRMAQAYHNTEFSMELARYMVQMTFHMADRYNDRFYMLGKGAMSLEKFIEADQQH